MQYCPCYERRNLKGTFKVIKQDQEDTEKFKTEIARRKRRKNFKDREHAEYKHLKRKYG